MRRPRTRGTVPAVAGSPALATPCVRPRRG